MKSAGFERLGKSGRMVTLLVGALLLALGLVLTASPAKATHTMTCEVIDGTRVCSPDPHTTPTVSADNAARTVNEGQTAANTGTFSDPDGNDTVALSASVGNITKNDANGTWSWSFNTNDGPAQGQTVTITASDGTDTVTTTFSLTVNNVAPTATFNAPASANEGDQITISLTSPSDPSSADTAAGFTYAFDCDGDGIFGSIGTSSTFSCVVADSGTRAVKGRIFDKDGGFTTYE